jgi:hypothetical protein
MSIGIFINKELKPSLDEIYLSLGEKKMLWAELVDFIEVNYKSVPEFRFYGKNYGWAFRYKKSGKALISIYPCEKNFVSQVVLGKKQSEKALESNIQDKIKELIKKAHPYFDGRWLFIKVKTKKDLSDIKKLLSIKFEKNKKLSKEK